MSKTEQSRLYKVRLHHKLSNAKTVTQGMHTCGLVWPSMQYM